MKIDTREKLFRFAANTNLEQIVAFHNDMKRLMQNEIVWINRAIEQGGSSKLDVVELTGKKDRYLGEFLNRLRENTFLMLFSHFEEWLFLVRDTFSSCSGEEADGRGSIKRFAPCLAGLGVDLSSRTWSFLCDCSDVRDCLLHANRRVVLSKNSSRLADLISRKGFDISVENDRLVIGGNLVLKLETEIGKLLDQAWLESDT